MAEVVYVATPADFAINSTTDVTLVTTGVTTAVGDQLYVDGSFSISNNSGATRVYIITLDFDGLGDIEFSTGSLEVSAVNWFNFNLRAVLDIRASNLCYMVVAIDQSIQAVVGRPSGGDLTMGQTNPQGLGWATSTSDASGTTTVSLTIRSADATATQTSYLHSFKIRRTPVPAIADTRVPYRNIMPPLIAQ